MIPRYNIKQIKNKLEGNTRWLDYIPPVLNFEPPRGPYIQSNLVLDQTDFSFLKDFNATFDGDDGYLLSERTEQIFVTSDGLKWLQYEAVLTDLGRVLLKSVDLILPDFYWQWITYKEDQFYSILDLITDFDNGRYNIGTISTYEDDVNDIVYELQIDGESDTYFYYADMYEIPELPEAEGQWVENINSIYIDVNKDDWDSIEFSFDPSSGLSVSLTNYFPVPSRWDEKEQVYISPGKLMEIRRQLFDKVQSTRLYIDDPEVFKFVFAGTIDKNQPSLFGDWDG